MHLLSLLVLAATTLATSLGCKILAIFPVPSPSHNLLAKGIVDALLKAGHEVSWATPYPNVKANKYLKIIDMSYLRPLGENLDMASHRDSLDYSQQFGLNVSALAVRSQELREALVHQQFDAVVTEWFFSDTDAGYAAIQQVPWIVLSGVTMHPYLEYLVDEMRTLATVPFIINNFPIPMSFWQRFANTAMVGAMWTAMWFDSPNVAARYEEYFAPLAAARGVPLPPFHAALHNISVLLVNSHPSVAPAQSLPPNVVEIAGYHIDEARPELPKNFIEDEQYSKHAVVPPRTNPASSEHFTLPEPQKFPEIIQPDTSIDLLNLPTHWNTPRKMRLRKNKASVHSFVQLNLIKTSGTYRKDIKDILDSSPQGVIYFSMGSIVRAAEIPEKTKKDLVQILGELPYTVLWKFDENLPGLPKNVHIKPWWPQASVLAHSNIKLFITHGGLLSTLEAVHFGVPLLAVPVFGDQPGNAYRAVQSGYALSVPYSPDMGTQLRATLKIMLEDDRYYHQAKYLSRLFNSRPVSPASLIAHYVQLAVESKGAYHLRSKTYQYAWYQRWMLDQLAALLAALWLLGLLLRTLLRTLCGSRQESGKRQGKLKKN